MRYNKQEEKYIAYRKRKAFFDSLCFYLCRIFPVKKNLISVCSYEGKGGFGCNPKYVVMELHKRNPSYEFVWFLNKESWNKELPGYIRKVPNTLWSRAYWLTRSKVWIDNYRKPLGTIKRKNQYYLNTNHYTIAIKATGLLRGSGFSPVAYMVSKNDSDMIDDLVIDSKWCESCFDKALVYNGRFMKTGAPRCDVLYGDRLSLKEQFRKKHNIPLEAKVVMYAPTFREGANNGKRYVFSQKWSLDFKRLLSTLEKKFGGTWYLCVRVHPQLAPTFKEYKDEELQGRIIDESQADDMYELLAGMDVYITDYSSACFEAGFAQIPVFLYADDVQQYAKGRGSLMWNLATDSRNNIRNNKEITPWFNITLPFNLASNNDELVQDIEIFDIAEYTRKLQVFFNSIGLVFDGRASERLANLIKKKMNDSH